MKILFVQSKLVHYRVKFLEELSDILDCEISVAHSGCPILDSKETKRVREIVLKCINFSGFRYQRGLISMLRDYDVVILPFDPHEISFYFPLFWFGRKIKFIYFGIGLGRSRIANELRRNVLKKNNVLLYSFDSVCKWSIDLSTDSLENLNYFFNTIDVPYQKNLNGYDKRNTFVFVGSLDKRKGLERIVSSFYLYTLIDKKVSLVIVGSGPARKTIELLVRKLNIEDRVSFKGSVTDGETLLKIYSRAIASLHFSQAGLSVLQSLGHGVPCIVGRDAISGGEKINAIHEYNSLVVNENVSDFCSAMYRLASCEQRWKALSNNAFEFYANNCSIKSMAKVFAKEIIAGSISTDIAPERNV